MSILKNSVTSVVLLLWVILIAAHVLHPPVVVAGEGLVSWGCEFGLSSVYDGNILRYSDKYLTRFDRGEDEGRFHIVTKDDLILTNAMRAAATFDFIGAVHTTLALEFRHRTYTKNGIKDWSYYSAAIRQALGRRMSAGAGYTYIPEFYTRHYRDEDWVKRFGTTPMTFQPFDYKKDEIKGWIQQSFFRSTRARLSASYARYFYNQHFTEYDARNRQIGVEISQPIFDNLRIIGSYGFVSSRAAANDAADPSYDEDSFALNVSWRLPTLVGRNNTVNVGGEYARRCFNGTKAAEVDRFHTGRRDYDYRLSLAYTVQLTGRFFLECNYGWHARKAETSAVANAEYLSNEKDYHQYQLGIEAKYVVSFFAPADADFEGEQ